MRVVRLLRRAPATALFTAVLTVAAVVAAACQATAPPAATVNGHEISQSSVDGELRAIAANTNYVNTIQQSQPVVGPHKGTFDLAFTDRVLTRQIYLELVHEEILRRHLTVSGDDLSAALDDQRSQVGTDQQGRPLWDGFPASYQQLLVRRDAEVTVLENALAGVRLDDATITKFYDDNAPKLFAQNCVSHILVPSQAQAQQIRNQIVAGADFAALARQFSQDPGSAPKGGDLGCAAPGTYVAEFETALQGLAVGELSQPVHTQFGYHIIKVTARKLQPIDQVRGQIIRQLESQAGPQLNQFLQNAILAARITVDGRFGTFQKSGANTGVVPPNPPPAVAGGPTTTSPLGGPQTPASAPPASAPPASTTPASTPPASAPPASAPPASAPPPSPSSTPGPSPSSSAP